MNPWFDYGFGQALFAPQTTAFSPLTYALPQAPFAALPQAPFAAFYARQPFLPSAVAGYGYTPYGVGEVISQSPAVQPSTFGPSTFGRPIGFQPPIAAAGSLPQFQGLPQFQHGPSRLPTDEEIEDLISEALDVDPFLAGNGEVEVRCENGQVTLTGNVQHKRIKHAIGEIAWSVPGIVDVQNNLELASRRRIRAGLRKEATQGQGQQRK